MCKKKRVERCLRKKSMFGYHKIKMDDTHTHTRALECVPFIIQVFSRFVYSVFFFVNMPHHNLTVNYYKNEVFAIFAVKLSK